LNLTGKSELSPAEASMQEHRIALSRCEKIYGGPIEIKHIPRRRKPVRIPKTALPTRLADLMRKI
jgi:hypothetical protein